MIEYNGYNIVPAYGFNLVTIKAIGQGTVPTPLRGFFTTKTEAMRAIDFLKKGSRNGKAKSGSPD
jgi:hypothetical protein